MTGTITRRRGREAYWRRQAIPKADQEPKLSETSGAANRKRARERREANSQRKASAKLTGPRLRCPGGHCRIRHDPFAKGRKMPPLWSISADGRSLRRNPNAIEVPPFKPKFSTPSNALTSSHPGKSSSPNSFLGESSTINPAGSEDERSPLSDLSPKADSHLSQPAEGGDRLPRLSNFFDHEEPSDDSDDSDYLTEEDSDDDDSDEEPSEDSDDSDYLNEEESDDDDSDEVGSSGTQDSTLISPFVCLQDL